MEEAIKDIEGKKGNNLINGIIVVGIFATAFYFIFLRGKKGFSQTPQPNNEPLIVDGVAQYTQTKVPDSYLVKQSYSDPNNPSAKPIEGYPMPPDPNMLNWSSEKSIEVITKPTTETLFYSVEPKTKISITRNGSDIVGYRRTPDNPNLHMRNYDKIMNEVILVNKSDFIT